MRRLRPPRTGQRIDPGRRGGRIDPDYRLCCSSSSTRFFRPEGREFRHMAGRRHSFLTLMSPMRRFAVPACDRRRGPSCSVRTVSRRPFPEVATAQTAAAAGLPPDAWSCGLLRALAPARRRWRRLRGRQARAPRYARCYEPDSLRSDSFDLLGTGERHLLFLSFSCSGCNHSLILNPQPDSSRSAHAARSLCGSASTPRFQLIGPLLLPAGEEAAAVRSACASAESRVSSQFRGRATLAACGYS